MAYFWLNDHETAITHFREGLKLDPEHKGCKKGHAAFEEKRYEEAIEIYTEAIAVEPDHINFARPTRFLIVKSYSKNKEHEKAIRMAREIVEKDGEDPALDAQWALGDALMDADKFEEALRVFRDALESVPDSYSETDDGRKAKQKVKEAEVALKQSK